MSAAIRAMHRSAIPSRYPPTTGEESARSSTQTRLGTKYVGATAEASCPGIPAPNWPFPESTSKGDGLMKGRQVKFQIGDEVRDGMHVGTVTDVGTVLIQVKTTEGRLRVVCPWELVKTGVG